MFYSIVVVFLTQQITITFNIMILNSVYLLIFIAVLFVFSSFLAQKTEKQCVVKFGILLLIIFSLTFFNLLLLLTNQI